jgi:hypothetical protein
MNSNPYGGSVTIASTDWSGIVRITVRQSPCSTRHCSLISHLFRKRSEYLKDGDAVTHLDERDEAVTLSIVEPTAQSVVVCDGHRRRSAISIRMNAATSVPSSR